MDIGWGVACATPLYPVNAYAIQGPNVGVDIGGTVTYTTQITNDDPFNVNPAKWTDVGTSGTTVDSLLALVSATTAVRVIVASHTAGTLAISYSQGK